MTARDILADLSEAEAEHLLILRAVSRGLSASERNVVMKALGVPCQPQQVDYIQWFESTDDLLRHYTGKDGDEESPDAGSPYFDGIA